MTSEHVWKLNADGRPEEWHVTSRDNGDDYGYTCVLCDDDSSFRYDGTMGQERCFPMARQADSGLVEQLRIHSRLARQWEIDAALLRADLAKLKKEAERDAKGVEGAIKWANLHRIQADEQVACVQHEAAQLRTRVAELEAQLAQCQIEEDAHAEK